MTDPTPTYRDPSCGHSHTAPTPDVAGSLLGLRGWGLTDDGWLRGATYQIPWAPGWNDAVCLVARRLGPTPKRPGFGHPFWGRVHGVDSGIVFPLTPDDAVDYEDGWEACPCKGLDRLCACGFYAYYDEQQGRVNQYGNIRGVIEATGRCVVGPKGFRAQRARIVAVVRPTNFKPRLSGHKQREVNAIQATVQLFTMTRKDLHLRPWFGGSNRFGILWGACVLGLALLGVGASDLAAMLGAVGIAATIVGALTWGSRYRTRRLMTNLDRLIAEGRQQIAGLTEHVALDDVMALLAEHYPDVKVYPSMVQLLADYPPSDVRGLLDIEFTQDGD